MLTNLFKHWTYRVFAPGALLRTTYESFQDLLIFDSRCHEIMADLESLYYQGNREDFCKIFHKYSALAENVEGMVLSLQRMAPGAYADLPAYFNKFNFYAQFFFAPPELHFGEPFVLPLNSSELSTDLAGAKSCNLAKLQHSLGLKIPQGYVVTTNSFAYFLEYNNLRPAINTLLAQTDITSLRNLSQISSQITKLIQTAEIPPEILEAILGAQTGMQEKHGADILFAVRSSAISEDGQCSFAGQYSSYLNVSADKVVTAYIDVLCSKYSPEALLYRINCGLSDEETVMAALVLIMIPPVSAGVVYTTDPSGKEANRLYIHATPGLGDTVVSGQVIPDLFTVDKNTSQLADPTNTGTTPLTNAQIHDLSEKSLLIEQHFNSPQDIEWALDHDGSIVFLQSRELHIFDTKEKRVEQSYSSHASLLFQSGVMAASGSTCAKAWVLDSTHPLEEMEQGAILVIKETLPSYVRALHRASGVIAQLGSSAGHFATVCREFSVPLLLGVGVDIERIHHGDLITLTADKRTVSLGNHSATKKKLPPYKKDKDLPFFRKLHRVLDFITPLKLVDPQSIDFVPESCRSLHDIIRFSHEMAIQSMFSIGNRCGTIKGGKKKLQTELPFEVFLVDVDGGMDPAAGSQTSIDLDLIRSTPFKALWRGFSHPDIHWGDKTYYNWKSYDQMAMSDAFAFQSDKDSASYAVLGKDYLNINIRFGYHFTVIDALCEKGFTTNYCGMRFAGGGGDFEGRELRILFLRTVLDRLGFDVTIKGDLLDAKTSGISADVLLERIESLGKLLGVSKQMDMHFKDMTMVELQVENFFKSPSS